MLVSRATNHRLQNPRCIFKPGKPCDYPKKLQITENPYVFIISSTTFKEIISWFKEVFNDHIRQDDGTTDGIKFDVKYFTDFSSWDFCNNICIPIHQSWFCIAIIKEELLPQYAQRKKSKIISGYIIRLNPNVFFEVGLAMERKKDVIFYAETESFFCR